MVDIRSERCRVIKQLESYKDFLDNNPNREDGIERNMINSWLDYLSDEEQVIFDQLKGFVSFKKISARLYSVQRRYQYKEKYNEKTK